MSQSNIDYLFQVFAPATDRAASASRDGSEVARFDEHLSQASTSAVDVAAPPRRDVAQTVPPISSDNNAPAVYDRPSSAASDTAPQERSSENANSGSSSDSSCATCEDAAPEDDGAKKPDADDRDDEPADSEIAAGAAAASEAKNGQTPAAETKPHKEHAKGEKAVAIMATAAETAAAAKTAAVENATQPVPVADAVQTPLVAHAAVQVEHNEPPAGESTTGPAEEHGRQGGVPGAIPSANVGEGTEQPAPGDLAVAPAAESLTKAPRAVQQQAIPAEVAKESAAARRSNATSRDSDNDRSARDDKKSGDAPTAKGPVSGNSNTSEVAAVAANVFATNPDLAAAVEKASDDERAAIKPVGNKAETALGPLGRTLRTAVETTRGSKTASAGDAPRVDPARFIGRVARAIHTASERGGTLQLRLAPPELGSLKIELSVTDGAMSATLEADNATARRLLLDHLPALRDRLAEQNIRVERFDVDVRQDDISGQANPRGSNHNPYQHQAEHQSQPRRTAATTNVGEQADQEPTVIAARISSTGINLVI